MGSARWAIIRTPSSMMRWPGMRCLAPAALLLLAAPPLARSQEDELKKSLLSCAALEIEAARLDCFEQLTRAVSQIPTEAPAKPVSRFKEAGAPGKWKVDVATSPVDDGKVVSLSLVDEGDRMLLGLTCREGKPQVYVSVAKYLGADSTMVVSRLGSAKAESKRWPLSTNHKAAFYPGDTAVLIRKMLAVDRLVVQLSPLDENTVTVVFPLSDLPAVVAPLKEACRLP